MSSNKEFYKRLSKKVILVAAISILGIFSLILLIPAMNVNSVSIANSITNTGSSVNSAFTPMAEEEEKNIVPLDQIVSGGPPPDGIPSIDDPKFISVKEADSNLEDSELVLGLNIDGDVRAYPLQILVWHEIVNDKIGGVPVAVTYCPLCFTNQERSMCNMYV